MRIDKNQLRKRTLENPKWVKKYVRGSIVGAAIGLVAGWFYVARSITDYWNPIKQAKCINQLCQHGQLRLNLEESAFNWKPDVTAHYDSKTNRTYYDIPEGEFYFDHKINKFFYEPSKKSLEDKLKSTGVEK